MSVGVFKKTVAKDGRVRIHFLGVRLISWNFKRSHFSLPQKKWRRMIAAAIADPNGYGGLSLKLWNLGISQEYEYLFYEMKPGAVCIDCGANMGKFTDVVLHQGGISYAFEPGFALHVVLSRKYAGNANVRLFNAAVGTGDGTAIFNLPANARKNPIGSCESGSLVQRQDATKSENIEKVKVMDLAKFLKQEFGGANQPAKPIYLLKLDVEGSEFEIVEKLITEGIHKLAEHIVVETHERAFADGEERLARLRRIILEAGADNVDLGWI